MSLPLPPVVAGVLGEGRQAYVAVNSTAGPHVTPELYAWSDGRLWFAAASTTLKAKVLRRDPSLGVLVNVAGRSVIATGSVTVYDPRRPWELAGRITEVPGASRALTRYTTRNASDLLAFVGDTVSGRLGRRLPPARLLFALAPERLALVENDELGGVWGWGPPGSADGPGEDDADQPDERESPGDAVPSGGERAVAAFPGPVALPARWFAEEQRVHVPRALTGLLGLGATFPVSVVTDDYAAPGPAAKTGTLVRGEGRFDPDDGASVLISPERIVEWDGIETSSETPG